MTGDGLSDHGNLPFFGVGFLRFVYWPEIFKQANHLNYVLSGRVWEDKMHGTTLKISLLMCCFLVSIFMSKTSSAYLIVDVDNFIINVQANPSQYNVDFSNDDQIYKVQFEIDGQIGYRVFADKNSPVIKIFDSWKIKSQGPCGYYWDNQVVGVAIFNTTYENGTTKLAESTQTVRASRSTCTLFDNQIDTSGVHPGFAECPGIGSIAHSIFYISCVQVSSPPLDYLNPLTLPH